MILFANGCSHTAGAEIEFTEQGECYDKAWPAHLAKFLDFEDVVNLAISGASSARIVRTTFEYFMKEMSTPSFNPKDYFCVIAWPGLYRTEIKNGGYDNGWQPLVVGNDKFYKSNLDIMSYAYYRSWTVHAEPIPQTILYLHNILLLQYFLRIHRLKYLFWSASNSAPTNADYVHLYKHQVYSKRYPFLYNSDYSYCKMLDSNDQVYSEFSKHGHYDETAHKWFANYLHKYLTIHKLL